MFLFDKLCQVRYGMLKPSNRVKIFNINNLNINSIFIPERTYDLRTIKIIDNVIRKSHQRKRWAL